MVYKQNGVLLSFIFFIKKVITSFLDVYIQLNRIEYQQVK